MGLLPDAGDGLQGAGLPRPGRTGDRIEPVPAGQDLDDGVLLVRRQPRNRGGGGGVGVEGVDGVPGVQARTVSGFGGGHDGGFIGQGLDVGEDSALGRVEDGVAGGGDIRARVEGERVAVVVERDGAGFGRVGDPVDHPGAVGGGGHAEPGAGPFGFGEQVPPVPGRAFAGHEVLHQVPGGLKPFRSQILQMLGEGAGAVDGFDQ